jgi:hypothetical protein
MGEAGRTIFAEARTKGKWTFLECSRSSAGLKEAEVVTLRGVRTNVAFPCALLAFLAATLFMPRVHAAPRSPTRLAVESSSITSVGYNARQRILDVQFHSGAVYRYWSVPKEVHAQFLKAPSKGRYFSAQIRSKYPFQKLRGTTQ